MEKIILIYHSNNSGGYWWLKDADWHALASAGWNVHWGDADAEIIYGDRPLDKVECQGHSVFGALATSAAGEFDSVQDGLDSFSGATGQDPAALGCSCCGSPHSFEWRSVDGSDSGYVDVIRPASGRLSW